MKYFYTAYKNEAFVLLSMLRSFGIQLELAEVNKEYLGVIRVWPKIELGTPYAYYGISSWDERLGEVIAEGGRFYDLKSVVHILNEIVVRGVCGDASGYCVRLQCYEAAWRKLLTTASESG